MKTTQIAIIGGGPAGMAAAIAAYDAGCTDLLILERDHAPGGILQQCIHNGFGLHRFGEELTGPEYAHRFIKEFRARKIPCLCNTMVLDITPDRVITAMNETDGIFQIQAGAIVLAMGCRERSRGALNIPGTRPAGVYTAGTAQRWMNLEGCMPGKEVVILGSGDIGLIMARRMTLEGAKVKAVCELMPYSGGLTRNIVQCLQDFDIPLKLSHTIAKIHGNDRLEGVTIARVDEHLQVMEEGQEYVPCDTLLLSCGLIPENELTRQMGIALDPVTGGAVVDENRQTTVPGVFACGNVLHVHDLVDYVSEEAELAGRCAAAYASQGKQAERQTISIRGEDGVRYTVPQQIHVGLEETTVKVYFRVGKIFDRVKLVVECEGEALLRLAKRHMAPGEMEHIEIPTEKLPKQSAVLVIRVEEGTK